MFTIIDRYILKQVSIPLLTSLCIGLLMLLAERLVRLLDTTMGKKNSFSVIFEMLAYLVPHYLGTAIPAALFLGLLFGFNNISKNQELDAMMAAGYGLHRLARSTFYLAALFAFVSFFVFGWVQPYTRYAYRSVVYEIQNVDAFYLAEEGVFMQSGTRTFILDKLDRSANTFEHIFVYDLPEGGGFETLTAERGALIPVPDDVRPVLRLENGFRLTLGKVPEDKTKSQSISAGRFVTSDTPLGKLNRALFRPRGNDEREFTLPELMYGKSDTKSKVSPVAKSAELNHRLVSVADMLILPFLALPFAIGRARSPRAYRIGLALVVVIAFHEVIEQGAVAAKNGSLPSWLAMWVPVALLALYSTWRFFRVAYHVATPEFDGPLVWLSEKVQVLWSAVRRRQAKLS
jgi:lipopolysaccharide export system permease protein